MRVYFRFLCIGMPLQPGFRDIEVDEGATVEQAVTAYLKFYQMDDFFEKLPEATFMIGSNAAQRHTVLRDKDEVIVLRIPEGG